MLKRCAVEGPIRVQICAASTDSKLPASCKMSYASKSSRAASSRSPRSFHKNAGQEDKMLRLVKAALGLPAEARLPNCNERLGPRGPLHPTEQRVKKYPTRSLLAAHQRHASSVQLATSMVLLALPSASAGL